MLLLMHSGVANRDGYYSPTLFFIHLRSGFRESGYRGVGLMTNAIYRGSAENLKCLSDSHRLQDHCQWSTGLRPSVTREIQARQASRCIFMLLLFRSFLLQWRFLRRKSFRLRECFKVGRMWSSISVSTFSALPTSQNSLDLRIIILRIIDVACTTHCTTQQERLLTCWDED